MQDKNYLLIDDFIWDNFGLVLEEDLAITDFYSLAEIKQQVIKRIKELGDLGYNLKPEQIVKYEIRDTTEIVAGTKSVANNQYLFVISKYAARKKNERYFDAIIFHELCHMLQFEHLFNNGFIKYNGVHLEAANKEAKEYVHSVLKVDGGHTPLWTMFKTRINNALMLNPPIAPVLEEKDLVSILLESTYQSDSLAIDDWIED